MMTVILWVQQHWILPVFIVFMAIVLTTYWPGRKSRIERHGRIPFEDDR